MLQMLKIIDGRLAALTITPVAWVMSYGIALAQDNANVRGALETNQEALTAVQDSSLTSEGVTGASQTLTNSLLAIAGFIGIAMVVIGTYRAYKIQSEGEQSRDSMVGPVMMGVFGGLMTVAALVTAAFVNAFFGLAA